MKAIDLRSIVASEVKDLNAFYGDNTGSFEEHNYKINYQISSAILIEHQRTYVVDFDIWCEDTVDVETITDNIESLFNRRTYESATF